MRRGVALLAVVLAVLVVCSAAAPRKKKKSFAGPTKGGAGSSAAVVDKGLAVEEVTYRSIVAENAAIVAKDTGNKRFSGDTLGYVTPWGALGYDEAKRFAQKFSYVAPVWYQVDAGLEEGSMLRGGHDVDQGWIGDVRSANKAVKITPRFLWDGWTGGDYTNLLGSNDLMERVGAAIGGEVKQQGYDGVVLDFGYLNTQAARKQFIFLLRSVANAVRPQGGQVILVVPPYILGDGPQLFSAEEFRAFSPYVDKFQIMCYDYVAPDGRPAANAPLSWITQTVFQILPPSARTPENAGKLMLGMNLYGKDYSFAGAHTILGNDYLALLEKFKPELEWLDEEGEHRIVYDKAGSEHILYYPSLLSVKKRIELAESLGVGLALWELSQGLPYFLALF